MRRVLFLAYFFPPLGGAGVQRSAKFVQYLPRHGYEPVVITGPGDANDRWAPTDMTLVTDLPSELEVRRVRGPVPRATSRWRRRSERLLALPSRFGAWWVSGAVEQGRAAASIDLVYVSMSPFETAAAAERLAREHRVPWVADLRDPWALDEMTVYPTRLHRRLERARMRRRLSGAAAVIMNTREATEAARAAFPGLRLMGSIPNGFDEADFAGPEPDRTDSAFRIVHTGYLHTDLGIRHPRGARRALAGAEPGVDFLARSHVFLLQALAQLIARQPAARTRIEVHFAGILSGEDRAVIAGFPYPDVVHTPGYLSHDQTVALVRSADLLFLPMHDLPQGVRARIVPGKTYEYLASGRPILGALPEGDARDLLTEVPHARLCRPTDVPCLMQAIETCFDEFLRTGRPSSSTVPSASRYERKALTSELAGVFDRVLGVSENRKPTSPTRVSVDG